MIRNNFETESRIVRADFGKLIERLGGKGAGLKLIDELIRKGELHFPMMNYHCVNTAHYVAAEAALNKTVKELEDLEDEALKKNNEFNQVIDAISQELRGAFQREFAESRQAHAPVSAHQFHLRSSTTLEDFKDDRYFGTFQTAGYEALFWGNNSTCEKGKLIDLIATFYGMKVFGKERFNIGDEERLGLVLMPTVNQYFSPRETFHLIAYSGYPETKDSPAVIEVSKRTQFSNDPLELIFVQKDGTINICPARNMSAPRNYIPPTFEEFEGKELWKTPATQQKTPSRAKLKELYLFS